MEKKGSTWKIFELCPVHCFNCKYGGYDDEFDFIFSDNNKTIVFLYVLVVRTNMIN